ncbi:MAG: cyclopropane-fatty-acyl-phospholipid synthase family protein [Moritella sp.]|uniref:cyclopropane-fatty-acyl-phospholipid synthase family protein n=1 Tax=Moritella sp. TaxID=78556 RepID=UPI0029A2064C|nr:cyclopropane-fatty-acyl-phospholipid synthase family protein [Moritella sp.]MDX2319837.1 cyclopropane-fatty-acyl-phospholipid synthase family protein [Moritella sp.]
MSAENIQLNEMTESVGFMDKMAKKLIVSMLSKMTNACLIFEDNGEQFQLGDVDSDLHGKIIIHHASCYKKMMFGGSIGAGEAYMAGLWSSPDLTKVVQVLAREQGVLDDLEKRFARVLAIPSWIYHKARKNTESGSKKNILAHYDLGNDMYEQFLDKEMMYSSAIYPHSEADLEQAQLHKIDTICQRLDLKAGETLLEIGTGWGALAIYAAQHYGVHVTTTTISDAQHDYAKARIESLGLADKITLLKQDYRTLSGEYDKLVSIEMIEAVGHEYLSSFFTTCNKHLKPHGKMLIQSITIADQRYDSYRKGVDFIQRYIFPGGCLPSISVMADNVATHTDMMITGLHDIGQDYAKTLQHWHQRFDTALPQVRTLGYDDTFIRLWKFYFSYCEGAFLERKISTVHLIAVKPEYRS